MRVQGVRYRLTGREMERGHTAGPGGGGGAARGLRVHPSPNEVRFLSEFELRFYALTPSNVNLQGV